MISVLIPTPVDEWTLVETLAALVPGIADGILRDAVIVGPSSTRVDDIAEAAGATRLIVDGARSVMIAQAAREARSRFCLVLTAGFVPLDQWIGALGDGLTRLMNARDAGLMPLAVTGGLAGAISTIIANQMAFLTGRPDPRHGVLVFRDTLQTDPDVRFRFIGLDARLGDRRKR